MRKIKISEELTEKVKEFEGLRLRAYKCPSGVWTIGYGHTSGAVNEGMEIGVRSAESFLRQDLKEAARNLEATGIALERQGQMDALVDFVFNMGITKFRQSTLCKLVKMGANDDRICDELLKWVYGTVDGRKVMLRGLMKRRTWEARRWRGRD